MAAPGLRSAVVRAAFDIGSGATKLCVARVPLIGGGGPEVLHEEEVNILLREDLAARGDGRIGAAVLATCAEEIARMQALARGLGATQYAAVATAVFREASNGNAFVQGVLRAELGLNVAIVSQELEGELGHRTAAALAPAGVPPQAIVSYDSGGGSFQVTCSLGGGGYECFEGPMGSSNSLALMLELQGRDLGAGDTPNPASAADVGVLRQAIAARLAALPVPAGLAAKLEMAGAAGAAGAGRQGEEECIVCAIGGDTCMFNTARIAVALTRTAPMAGAGAVAAAAAVTVAEAEAEEAALWFSADDVAAAIDVLRGSTDAELEGKGFPQPYMVVTKLVLLEVALRGLGMGGGSGDGDGNGGRAATRVRYCASTGSTLGMFSVPRLWEAQSQSQASPSGRSASENDT